MLRDPRVAIKVAIDPPARVFESIKNDTSANAREGSTGTPGGIRTHDPRFRNATERTAREVDWSGQTRTSWRRTRTYNAVFGSAVRVDPDLSGLQRTRSVALKWHSTRRRWKAQSFGLSPRASFRLSQHAEEQWTHVASEHPPASRL